MSLTDLKHWKVERGKEFDEGRQKVAHGFGVEATKASHRRRVQDWPGPAGIAPDGDDSVFILPWSRKKQRPQKRGKIQRRKRLLFQEPRPARERSVWSHGVDGSGSWELT